MFDRIKDDYKKYYYIDKVIGSGGYGNVYLGKDKETQELRAIKVMNINEIKNGLKSEYMTDEIEDILKNYIDGFIQEFNIMKICSKNNTNIYSVKCYEYFNTEKEFVLIMELCDDNLLNYAIRIKREFTQEEILNIMTQLNNTFRIMKENNIVHRDLKLENILIKYNDQTKKDYTVKLTDYGVSKRLFSLSKKCKTHVGTITTMAPEILEGEGKNEYNYKCDLWSIGIIIYRLLFKEHPYPGLTEIAILNKIKKLGTKNLKKTENKDLDNLIKRVLEKNPKKRLDWDEYLNHPFFNQTKEEDDKQLSFSNNYSIKTRKESENEPEALKVILLGESCADKTALVNQLCKDDGDTSLSAQFMSITFEFPEFNKLIKFDIWDTAGQEKYRSLFKIFLKDAKVIIFVYDITSYESFDSIKNYWYHEVKYILKEKMPILAVVGNKIEKYENMQVRNEDGQQFADEIGAIFQTTSKLSNSDINILFDNIGKKYLDPKFDYKENKDKDKSIQEHINAKTFQTHQINGHKLIASNQSKKKDCIII